MCVVVDWCVGWKMKFGSCYCLVFFIELKFISLFLMIVISLFLLYIYGFNSLFELYKVCQLQVVFGYLGLVEGLCVLVLYYYLWQVIVQLEWVIVEFG